jgi:hypothetical protein
MNFLRVKAKTLTPVEKALKKCRGIALWKDRNKRQRLGISR